MGIFWFELHLVNPTARCFAASELLDLACSFEAKLYTLSGNVPALLLRSRLLSPSGATDGCWSGARRGQRSRSSTGGFGPVVCLS